MSGRPKGTTVENIANTQLRIVAARNDITILYAEENKKLKNNQRMKRGRLEEIVDDARSKRGLPKDFTMNMGMLKKRIKRGKLMNMCRKERGQTSPLAPLEDTFVQIILRMSRIGASLKPSQCVSLINDVIERPLTSRI